MISATFRITPKLYKHMSRRIQQHSIQQAYSHFCQPARAYSSSRVKTGRFRKPQHVPKAATMSWMDRYEPWSASFCMTTT